MDFNDALFSETQRALARQEADLDRLRDRVNILLSGLIAASGFVLVFRHDHTITWALIAGLTSLIGVSICTVLIDIPRVWAFEVDMDYYLVDSHPQDETVRDLAHGLHNAHKENEALLLRLHRAFLTAQVCGLLTLVFIAIAAI